MRSKTKTMVVSSWSCSCEPSHGIGRRLVDSFLVLVLVLHEKYSCSYTTFFFLIYK